jgi:hypothetical protein
MRRAEREPRAGRGAAAAFAAVALFACAAPPRPSIVGSLVTGVVGVRLADAPGAEPDRIALGSPALVLEQRDAEGGAAWYRLLAADGRHGWWSGEPTGVLAARVAAGAEGSELLTPFPGDAAADEEVHSMQVAPRALGELTGASALARVASLRQLQIPEASNPFLTPWLALRFGELEGYAPASRVQLTWDPRDVAGADAGLLGALGRFEITGLARRPFLGPVEAIARDALPAAERVCLSSAADAEAFAWAPLGKTEWRDTDALVHIPHEADGAPGALLFMGAGREALWVVLGAQHSACIRLEGTRPIPVAYATPDLDADGRPEWVVEAVELYGDGYTSAIWILGGGSLTDRPALMRIPLGGSGGEPGGTRVEASWRVERHSGRDTLRVERAGSAAELVPYP